jgi:hypothetical protein
MRTFTVALALATLLLSGSVGQAQTPEIQKQIEKKLGDLKKDQAKKDQATLEDLLSLALKSNPDIRVAESKLRESEAELYRARMKVFNRIVTLQQELKGLRAEADNAKARYEELMRVFAAGAAPQPEVNKEMAVMHKAKTELARAEAELDLLVGRHTDQSARWIVQTLESHWSPDVRIWELAMGKVIKAGDVVAGIPNAQVPESMADKIRKALDQPFKVGPNQANISAEDVLALLRERTKGVNIQANVKDQGAKASLLLTESIPLGAFYQWAEDQFNWRFIIRDYGIVAVSERERPPGGMLLLDFWRKGAPPTGK